MADHIESSTHSHDPLSRRNPRKAATLFRPEDVCALESMVSAWAHLSDVGVDSLTSHDAVAKFLMKIKKRHDSLLAQVRRVGLPLLRFILFAFCLGRPALNARCYALAGADGNRLCLPYVMCSACCFEFRAKSLS